MLLKGTVDLAAQLSPVVTARMPQRGCRPGLSRQTIRSPPCGTTAGADAEAGTSTVTKRDSGSCEKKGFSLSNCFADHHHRCCRMRQGPPQHRGPAVCGSTESHLEGNRGHRGPDTPAGLRDFSPTNSLRGARARHCRHVLRSPCLPLPARGLREPASSPARSPCPHRGPAPSPATLGVCLIKVGWRLLAQVRLLPVEATPVFQRQAMVMSKAKLRTETF